MGLMGLLAFNALPLGPAIPVASERDIADDKGVRVVVAERSAVKFVGVTGEVNAITTAVKEAIGGDGHPSKCDVFYVEGKSRVIMKVGLSIK